MNDSTPRNRWLRTEHIRGASQTNLCFPYTLFKFGPVLVGLETVGAQDRAAPPTDDDDDDRDEDYAPPGSKAPPHLTSQPRSIDVDDDDTDHDNNPDSGRR